MRYLAICILLVNLGCSQETDNESEFHFSKPKIPVSETVDIATSNNRFAIDLYHQVRTEEGNLFFSPSSISVALSMTYAGAKGDTESEMAKMLHFSAHGEKVHEKMEALQAYWHLERENGIKLSLANRLWAQEGFELQDPFKDITREHYAAEIKRLNFSQSEQSRQTINQWIEKKTENKIKDLIPAGEVKPLDKLILTNAIYFYGTWANQFKKEKTRNGDFHISSNRKTEVRLMNSLEEYGFAERDGLKVLEMPYEGDSMSMIVLLPNDVDGLNNLESRMSFENLQAWTANLKKRKVKLTFPKFETTSTIDLKKPLQSLGMVSAFSQRTSDFSGISESEKLFIGMAIHKAFVDVNEEGTEAAAATAIGARVTSAPSYPAFRADHPFVFFIRDNRNGAILFMGRIENPNG